MKFIIRKPQKNLKLKKGCDLLKDNQLLDQSLSFAAHIIKLHDYLCKNKREFIISKQIIRSATSIGANINEANYASSSPDFISKMHIALKECAETEYWLKLLQKADYISEKSSNELIGKCISIKSMLVSTLNTIKSKK